jgi:alpha-amylase
VPTKWGDKSELLRLCEKARELGVGLIWDAVLSHRAGGDYVEEVEAVRVDERDRRREVGERRVIGAWTGFEFAGRGGKYSDTRLTKDDFNAVNWDDRQKEEGLWKFCGKEWARDVDGEFGNYDFL